MVLNVFLTWMLMSAAIPDQEALRNTCGVGLRDNSACTELLKEIQGGLPPLSAETRADWIEFAKALLSHGFFDPGADRAGMMTRARAIAQQIHELAPADEEALQILSDTQKNPLDAYAIQNEITQLSTVPERHYHAFWLLREVTKHNILDRQRRHIAEAIDLAGSNELMAVSYAYQMYEEILKQSGSGPAEEYRQLLPHRFANIKDMQPDSLRKKINKLDSASFDEVVAGNMLRLYCSRGYIVLFDASACRTIIGELENKQADDEYGPQIRAAYELIKSAGEPFLDDR